jgi:hypothetical protein
MVAFPVKGSLRVPKLLEIRPPGTIWESTQFFSESFPEGGTGKGNAGEGNTGEGVTGAALPGIWALRQDARPIS